MILRKETVDDILDRLRSLYDEGDAEKAAKELRRARKLHPTDPTFLEWEATFANDAGRYAEALEFLQEVLAAEPERPFARREKVNSLMGLGRFAEALVVLEGIGPDNAGDAAYHFDRASCLDRLGRAEEADVSFRKAARLDAEGFPRPLRLSREEFDEVVEAAMEEVPETLRPYLENVVLEVDEYPRSPPLDPGIDPYLLGLYLGVPRTERTQDLRDHLDRVFIFKRNLEIEFPRRDDLRAEIRKTVIHEIAHHFGLGEEDMGGFA
jgi:predicted Zn-dependent protease with MMP-like domain